MRLAQYKKYAWILLLPIVAILILAAIDTWQWQRSTDSDIFQEILGTLPSSVDSGRKIAVISDVDKKLWRLLRGYAAISPEADLILEPKDLPDLARKLQILARAKPVTRLTFFGTGDPPKGSKVTLQFTKQDPEIDRDDFEKLGHDYPDLPSAFSPHAQVVFFNCWAGSDPELLQAAGEAFLRDGGGYVIANRGLTRFKISSGGMFWSKEYAVITWIDRPNEIHWVRHEIQPQQRQARF